LGKVAEACLLVDAALLITADHGNIEEMLDLRSGDPDTDHTSNPVPIILIANEWKRIQPLSFGYQDLASLVPVGMIADVAPTVLSLFGLQTPEEMRAVDLLGMI
jgi:2,3-bisphosphoglycerate-independent phosphoglycerate mutase